MRTYTNKWSLGMASPYVPPRDRMRPKGAKRGEARPDDGPAMRACLVAIKIAFHTDMKDV